MPVSLTTRERASLKARAHSLEPVVHVGHAGVTAAVITEADRALTAHELIKVRIGGLDRQVRETLGDELARATDAMVPGLKTVLDQLRAALAPLRDGLTLKRRGEAKKPTKVSADEVRTYGLGLEAPFWKADDLNG